MTVDRVRGRGLPVLDVTTSTQRVQLATGQQQNTGTIQPSNTNSHSLQLSTTNESTMAPNLATVTNEELDSLLGLNEQTQENQTKLNEMQITNGKGKSKSTKSKFSFNSLNIFNSSKKKSSKSTGQGISVSLSEVSNSKSKVNVTKLNTPHPLIDQNSPSVKKGEKFYQGNQGFNTKCAKHALDAFIGHKDAFKINDLKTAKKLNDNDTIKNVFLGNKDEAKASGAISSEGSYASGYSGNTVKRALQEYVNKNNIQGVQVGYEDRGLVGNDSEGFPNLENAIQDMNQRTQNLDRFMLNVGSDENNTIVKAHWVTFAKDENGDLHLIDSKYKSGDQPEMTVEDYIRQRAKQGADKLVFVALEPT